MKKNDFLELYGSQTPQNIVDFMNAIIEMELFFDSQSLQYVYPTDGELTTAINRAMRVCCNLGLPLERHFRIRYISDYSKQTLIQVWKMSKAGYYLTLINGDPDNPMVGRMQWELIKRLI